MISKERAAAIKASLDMLMPSIILLCCSYVVLVYLGYCIMGWIGAAIVAIGAPIAAIVSCFVMSWGIKLSYFLTKKANTLIDRFTMKE